MSVQVRGATGNITDVNANGEIEVALTQTKADAGFVSAAVEIDTGSVTGSRYVKRLYATETGRLAVGMDTTLLNEYFAGSNVNTSVWTTPVNTMTITQASGFVNLNAGGSTVTGYHARLQSYRFFPAFHNFPLRCEIDAQFSQLPVANAVAEWGFFIATAASAPTDGVFFRYDSTAEFRCVVNFNGVESQSAALDASALVGNSNTQHFTIEVKCNEVHFYINSVVVAEIALPTGAAMMTNSMWLPVAARVYNNGTPSLAQIIKIGAVMVNMCDISSAKPWSHQMAGASMMCHQGQTGATLGTTCGLSNSLALAAAAALSNTAANFTGLGGQCHWNPTLAVPNDGILTSYLVPQGTSTLPGRSLYITGVTVESVVDVVLANTGSLIGILQIAYGHTGVSMATATSSTGKAPVRVPLGCHAFVGAAAVGTRQTTQVTFDTPIHVGTGEYIATVIKNVGTVTTSGSIVTVVGFNGYWE